MDFKNIWDRVYILNPLTSYVKPNHTWALKKKKPLWLKTIVRNQGDKVEKKGILQIRIYEEKVLGRGQI